MFCINSDSQGQRIIDTLTFIFYYTFQFPIDKYCVKSVTTKSNVMRKSGTLS
jgi:hypothetical protein